MSKLLVCLLEKLFTLLLSVCGMSAVISRLPPERQYAFKKHPQGTEVKGEDMKLIKPWNNDHNAYCELCGKGGNLLLCDYCNLSFHPHCLVPPLQTIPEVGLDSL